MALDRKRGAQHTSGIKITIDIPSSYLGSIDSACREEGISREELCRHAVIAYVGELARRDRQQAFGLWRGRDLGKPPAKTTSGSEG